MTARTIAAVMDQRGLLGLESTLLVDPNPRQPRGPRERIARATPRTEGRAGVSVVAFLSVDDGSTALPDSRCGAINQRPTRLVSSQVDDGASSRSAAHGFLLAVPVCWSIYTTSIQGSLGRAETISCYILKMTSVGIRELKDNLSRSIRRIEAGERIAVTARGRVVAELVPPGKGAKGRGRRRFDELVAAGAIRPPLESGDPTEDWPDIRLPPGTAAELIDADRGEA